MIKRTVEISSEPVHLTVKNEQLLIERRDENRTQLGSIPCEDIGVLVVDECGTTYTHAALTTLLKYDVAVVLCGRDHLPVGMLLPFIDHTKVVWRIQDQINISKPLCKQLWQQIVQAKIRAQAANLPEGAAERSKLLALARDVRSGDPENVESQAARIYWSVWLCDDQFRRDPDGVPPNNLLNYGYAVLRAAIARSVVACGLLPSLGLKHRNRSNAFCLADDLVEPFRPLVDDVVRELYRDGFTELTRQTKQPILELLCTDVYFDDEKSPLMVAIQRMVGTLVRCYEGVEKQLTIPSVEPGRQT